MSSFTPIATNWLSCLLLFVAFALIPHSHGHARERFTSIELSSAAQTAIDHGVTLTLDCHLAVIKPFLFFKLAHDKQKYSFTITRHALTNSFMVQKDDSERPQMFHSLLEATHYIESETIRLLGSYTKTNKLGQMRILLNKYELPGPIRLQAFISNDWKIDTGWMTWKFES